MFSKVKIHLWAWLKESQIWRSGFMPKNLFRNSSGGYTMVEVIIVLAIGGMIMAVALLAVPQLQRGARDSTRKNIANRMRAEIEGYASNNSGAFPFKNVNTLCGASDNPARGDWADFYQNTIVKSNIDIKDPTEQAPVTVCLASNDNHATTPYVAAFSTGFTYPTRGVLDILTGGQCQGSSVIANTNYGSFALVIGLDNNSHFCVDNR